MSVRWPGAGCHPSSVLPAAGGGQVELKVHRCLWSGDYPENSLPAIRECFRERVARAEIDVCMLGDEDFLVVHDSDLAGSTTGSGPVGETTRGEVARLRLCAHGRCLAERPPLLTEVVGAMAGVDGPTLLQLDAKDAEPWPWRRVEELARIVQPVRDRIVVGSQADWNLRRLARVDPRIRLGFDPALYLDWVSEGGGGGRRLPGARGAYGYLDDHPLATRRVGSTADYLDDRLGGLSRLVPGVGEVYLRLSAFEHMLDDDFNAARLLQRDDITLDVWTLDTGMPGWRERLARAVASGVNVVTTNTARALAEACSASGPPVANVVSGANTPSA
ncbi:MAG: glycerophosphodiester phosphodiesterase [Chloroflexota bacterium]